MPIETFHDAQKLAESGVPYIYILDIVGIFWIVICSLRNEKWLDSCFKSAATASNFLRRSNHFELCRCT